MGKRKYNWNKIQVDYDGGCSYDDLVEKHKMSIGAIAKAKKRGELITRTKSDACKLFAKNNPRTLTDETKRKISESRLKYLNEHPDKVPYLLNHSSKISYPEKIFMDALIRHKIEGWRYGYQFGIYCFDFAFIELKIDVEIDGGTHLTDKVKRIDERRDLYSKDKGWTVIRFTAKDVKNDVDKCILKLKEQIPS